MIRSFEYGWSALRSDESRRNGSPWAACRAEPSLPRFAGEALFADLVPPPEPGGLARYPLQERRGPLPAGHRTPPATSARSASAKETAEVWRAAGSTRTSQSAIAGCERCPGRRAHARVLIPHRDVAVTVP